MGEEANVEERECEEVDHNAVLVALVDLREQAGTVIRVEHEVDRARHEEEGAEHPIDGS